MPSITRRWKKIMAVACNHGGLALESAVDAVLRFRWDIFKPHTVVHLGDNIDMTAFMSSAPGTKNESEPIMADVDGGLDFLEKLRPTLYLCGNHEDRAWSLREHHNAIVSFAASKIVETIENRCKKLRIELVPYDGMWAYRVIGGTVYTHGTIYNEQASRDMAEMYESNVVHGHTHRAALSKGRNIGNRTAYCPGTLTDIPNMDYAKRRRATLAHSQGLVWGEYCDDQSVLWLHEQPRTVKEWRLPAA